MSTPAPSDARHAFADKVIAWMIFILACIVIWGVLEFLSDAIFGRPTVERGLVFTLPVAASLLVAQWIFPAGRFAFCLMALLSSGLLVLGLAIGDSGGGAFLGFLLGIVIALNAGSRTKEDQTALVRALRWTLFVPMGYGIGILVWSIFVSFDDPTDQLLYLSIGLSTQFAVFTAVTALIAPAARQAIILLLSAMTCFSAFLTADAAKSLFPELYLPLLPMLRSEELVMFTIFAAWALGTAAAAALVLGLLPATQRTLPTAAIQKGHRYQGSAPYLDNDLHRKTFFGRNKECRSLLSLVRSERLVVLFAKSGMGKSSLINAGLMQPLRRLNYIPLVVRLNVTGSDLSAALIAGVREAAKAAEVELVVDDDSSLLSFFKTAEFWSKSDDLLRPVLIIDQFEEIFTLHTPHFRRQFIRQLGKLIRGRSGARTNDRLGRGLTNIRVVLSMREDFLADLEEFARDIPAILQNRFRLGPLSREAASDAISKPATLASDLFDTHRFRFDDQAVERITGFLAKHRQGDVLSSVDEVEPVQLQLICHHVEEMVRAQQMASGAQKELVIHASDLGGDDQMEQVLQGFYDRTVAGIRPRRKASAVQRLCETRLISSGGRRLTEAQEVIVDQFKLSEELLRRLVDSRLLRSEPRLGSTTYEISHDRLVEPILVSRRKRIRRKQRMTALAVPLLVVIIWGISSNVQERLHFANSRAQLELGLMSDDAQSAMWALSQLNRSHRYKHDEVIQQISQPSVLNPSAFVHLEIAKLDESELGKILTHIRDYHDNEKFSKASENGRRRATFLGAVLMIVADVEQLDSFPEIQQRASEIRTAIVRHHRLNHHANEENPEECSIGLLDEDGQEHAIITNAEYKCFNPEHGKDQERLEGDSRAWVNRYEAEAFATYVGGTLPTPEELEKLQDELMRSWNTWADERENTSNGETMGGLRSRGTDYFEDRQILIMRPTASRNVAE